MEQKSSDLSLMLASGISQHRMYFDTHPRVLAISRQFVTTLQSVLRGGNNQEFTVGVYNSKFIREGKYLVGPSIAGRSLIDFGEKMMCGGFAFRLPLSPADLVVFFGLAAGQKEAVRDLVQARELMAASGLASITLLPPYSDEEDTEDFDFKLLDEVNFMASEFAPLLDVYQSLYETVAETSAAANGDGRVDLDGIRALGEELVTVSSQNALDVMHFMRYPDFDTYTIGHSVRVAALAAMLSRALGWPREIQSEVATAGLLHDLGKGRIPDEILYKNGRLDQDERRVIETHPMLGAQILAANGEHSAIVMSAAWGHHLREDGGGYPTAPRWFQRSTAAALIQVCDIFEALTAARPYKKALCPRRAYEIMITNRGTFQPHLLATFINTLGLYPPGSEVTLSDFRRAVVVSAGSHPHLPRVRVTHDPAGSPLAREDQPSLDLREVDGVDVAEFITVGVADGEHLSTAAVIETA